MTTNEAVYLTIIKVLGRGRYIIRRRLRGGLGDRRREDFIVMSYTLASVLNEIPRRVHKKAIREVRGKEGGGEENGSLGTGYWKSKMTRAWYKGMDSPAEVYSCLSIIYSKRICQGTRKWGGEKIKGAPGLG